jgi:MFS transporter, DHA3 family, tetracycline resistance protein
MKQRPEAMNIYLLLTGCATFATGVIGSVSMVYQIETVKLNPLQLVLVGTELESTCFIIQIPTGVLAEVYSRRLALVIG